ncbi:MAG: hypothetical protein AB7M12_04545 [Hyphomonadaceae bacterium]
MPRDAFDLEDAWAGLAEMIGWVVSAFGAPGEIAQRLGFLRRDRSHFLAWLAPLESLARRLLFIEAVALPASNAPAAFIAKGRILNAFRDSAPADPPAEAHAWRVAFRVALLGRSPEAPPSSRPNWVSRQSRASLLNALPLARRLEALLRLAQGRASAVARLARRLHAVPARAARVLTPWRGRPRIAGEALDAAQAEVRRLSAASADTS